MLTSRAAEEQTGGRKETEGEKIEEREKRNGRWRRRASREEDQRGWRRL